MQKILLSAKKINETVVEKAQLESAFIFLEIIAPTPVMFSKAELNSLVNRDDRQPEDGLLCKCTHMAFTFQMCKQYNF